MREKIKIITSVLIILAVVYLALSPCLRNDFTTWDDYRYIGENPLIRDFSSQGIQRIFTSRIFAGLYMPLVLFTYSLEYRFFGENPFYYHATNFILHLINCLLVFWLIFLVSGQSEVALITALLFGVHPMHVESVAWIAERKDMLYALFFLSSVICYLCYRSTGLLRYYLLSFCAFVISLTAKPMGIFLFAILLLFDYLLDSRISRRRVIDKIPFLVIPAVYPAIFVLPYKHLSGTLTMIPERLCSILFYLQKMLLPLKLSPIYPLNPSCLAISLPLAALFITLAFMFKDKARRILIFGTLFFLFGLLPILIRLDRFIIADRYTYIPYVGIFYIVACGFYWLYARTRENKTANIIVAVVMSLVIAEFSLLSHARTKVWKDGISLWSDTLRNYPDSYTAYNNRGVAYGRNGRLELALADFNRAVEIKPENREAYHNRAMAYFLKKQYAKSWEEIRKLEGLGFWADANFLEKLKRASPEKP